ncbi:MAG: HD domain-containing phosphohydrolase [Pyrinomonadaceae bacterium]
MPIVRHHHERWDGKGYPDGLKGEEIPATARVLSVVDCFDALREDRPYRQGMSRESAVDYLLRNSGTMYDPHVVSTFIANLHVFEAETRKAQAAGTLLTSDFGTFDQLPEAARMVEPAAGLLIEQQVKQQEEGSTPAPEKTMLGDKELSALYDLTQQVRSAATREEMSAVFTEKLRELVHYDSCAITLTQTETGEKLVAHAAGRHSWLLVGRKIVPGEGVTGWVLANQRPFCNTDPRLDFPPTLAERFAGYSTLAVYPLSSNEWKHGAVSLYSMSIEKYTEEQQHFIQEASMVFATALSEVANKGLTPHAQLEIPTVANASEPTRDSSHRGPDYSVN